MNREEALALANKIKNERYAIARRIHSGQQSITELLEGSPIPRPIQDVRVIWLLTRMSGVGNRRARLIANKVSLPVDARLNELSEYQRHQLMDAMISYQEGGINAVRESVKI